MLAISAAFVGALVLLNWCIDPSDRFGNNRLGVYVVADREVKRTEVVRFPHDALYTGNSRMHAIPASRLNGFRFFNGAFPASHAEEMYWFLHHYAQREQLVVIGIDMGAQDLPFVEGDIFRSGDWAGCASQLVNLKTVEYSFKTLFSHWAGKPGHYFADGSSTVADWGNAEKADDPAAGMVRLEESKNITASLLRQVPFRFSFFRKIAETLRERGIPCVVVMPPLHEEIVRHLEALHLQRECQAWVDGVRAIFPNVVNLTTSPDGAAGNFYARDPVHFKAEVGIRFMNEEVVPFALKVVGDHRK
ncbi:MAG: hypothetical protein ABIP20_18285 [Chthoniobacteraceae bacterium]